MRFTFCSGFFVPIRAHFFDPGLALFFIELRYVFLSCATSFLRNLMVFFLDPILAQDFAPKSPPKMHPGGFLVVATYSLQGCRATSHHITSHSCSGQTVTCHSCTASHQGTSHHTLTADKWDMPQLLPITSHGITLATTPHITPRPVR